MSPEHKLTVLSIPGADLDIRADESLQALQRLSHEMVGYMAMELNVHEVVIGSVSHYFGCEVCAPEMRQGTPPKECNERCKPR